jgi:uncharacterized protein YukE
MVARDEPAILPAPAEDGAVLPLPRGGPDGHEIANSLAGHLNYLSRLARDLGAPDPVEEYFSPVVGRWSDLEAEADRWRLVGDAARDVTESLNSPLGRLDAAWDGEAAESFIAYMQQVGLAGHDLADSMLALADVLDITAEGIREIVQQLATVLGEAAESASGAMALPVQGDERTRQYLDMMRRPTKELFEAVRQILEAFVQLCEGVDGSQAFQRIRMEHTFPAENWGFEEARIPTPTPTTPVPAPVGPDRTSTDGLDDLDRVAGVSPADFGGGGGGGGVPGGLSGPGGGAPTAATPGSAGGYTFATEQPPAPKPEAPAAAAAGSGGTGRAAGTGMMPMAPMMGAGQGGGGDGDRRGRSRVTADPADIFGKPEKASAPVIGDDDY